MPYLLVDGQTYPLAPGDNVVGRAAGAAVSLTGSDIEEHAAVVVVSDASVVLRRGDQPVALNGVELGVEPAPLIHGDKIEIAGRELFFGDERSSGNTQYVRPVRSPEVGTPVGPRAVAPTGITGGRLISLVDGREYMIPPEGLVLGRDPTCDVVIPGAEVSRRHAVIGVGPQGYVLTDTSANGVMVNGVPVASSTVLGQGDVVRIGGEELRFTADLPPAPPPAPAVLEVTGTGVMRGRVFELRGRLTRVGRGRHNDVVLPDESVSDSHATIEQREDGWYVVDLDSTNGTYVSGRRISGAAPLAGGTDLRFGGVKFIFRVSAGRTVDRAEGVVPVGVRGRGERGEEERGGAIGVGEGVGPHGRGVEGGAAAGGGRTRVIVAPGTRQRGEQAHRTVPGGMGERRGTDPRAGGTRILLWTILMALIVLGIFFLLMSR
jgi:pSer/pThr/pTyr-binding forkhead associated (FHA) protein